MKTTRFALTFLTSLMIATGLPAQERITGQPPVSPAASPVRPKPPVAVSFRVNLDKLAQGMPASMPLYRAGPDEQAKAQGKTLRARFGKNARVELSEVSGGIFAADPTRLWTQPTAQAADPKRLEKAAVLGRAKEFLAGIKGAPDPKTTVQRTSIDTMEQIGTDGSRQSRPVGASVTYRRLMNGHEVVGPGGKLKVFHDSNGDVAGYLRVWRKLTPEAEARPIIPLRDAVEQFRKAPLGNVLLSGVTAVEVTDLRLAYLEQGIAEHQAYVQPVYVFTANAQVKGPDGKPVTVPYTRYIEALAKPPEPLWATGKDYRPAARPKDLPRPGED